MFPKFTLLNSRSLHIPENAGVHRLETTPDRTLQEKEDPNRIDLNRNVKPSGDLVDGICANAIGAVQLCTIMVRSGVGGKSTFVDQVWSERLSSDLEALGLA